MTDIKELALKVAKEFTADVSTHDSLVDFAQRFLAAYLAEQVSPSKAQALDALDCLDDFARMADIDPIGPRKVLEDYINGAAQSSEEVRVKPDEFATIETASEERIRLALKAVEGLSTGILRDNMTNLFLLQGTAAIQTCKRLGVPIDNVLWGEQK